MNSSKDTATQAMKTSTPTIERPPHKEVLIEPASPNLPPELIDKLSRSLSWKVRRAIAQRDDLTEAQLNRLSKDRSDRVRQTIAQRRDLPLDVIKRLRKDKNKKVQQAIRWICSTLPSSRR